jgi:enamine deaminase RidA (YjgF/YER057c/UK114 family)
VNSPHQTLEPAGWKPPRGYANGIAASGRTLYLGGMIGWDAEQRLVSDDFVEQAAQCLRNIVAVLGEAGAGPEHLVRLTWFITDREEYLANLKQLGAAYREVLGSHFPAMSMVQVVALMEPRARVEVEATAVVP